MVLLTACQSQAEPVDAPIKPAVETPRAAAGDAVLRDQQSGAMVTLTQTGQGAVVVGLHTAGQQIDTTTLVLELSSDALLADVQPRAGLQIEREQQGEGRSVVHLHATATGEALADAELATLLFTKNTQASVAVSGALFLSDATLVTLTPTLLSFSN